MTMTAAGVAKLIEECGELTQILGKKLAYWHTDAHPDGKGSIAQRIQEEMADVQAAIYFVAVHLDLDHEAIEKRTRDKINLFGTWHAQIDNNDQGIDANASSCTSEEADRG